MREWFAFVSDEKKKEEITTRLQSFLKWIHANNPDFAIALTREDLSNVFLNEIEQPWWIQQRIKALDLAFISEINEYLEAYYANAPFFDETVKFVFQKPTSSNKKQGTITAKQLKYLIFLTKKHHRNIQLEAMSKEDATKLIGELIALG